MHWIASLQKGPYLVCVLNFSSLLLYIEEGQILFINNKYTCLNHHIFFIYITIMEGVISPLHHSTQKK